MELSLHPETPLSESYRTYSGTLQDLTEYTHPVFLLIAISAHGNSPVKQSVIE